MMPFNRSFVAKKVFYQSRPRPKGPKHIMLVASYDHCYTQLTKGALDIPPNPIPCSHAEIWISKYLELLTHGAICPRTSSTQALVNYQLAKHTMIVTL